MSTIKKNICFTFIFIFFHKALFESSFKNNIIFEKEINRKDSLLSQNLFSMINLSQKTTDSLKKISDYYYVDFWASWCTACINQVKFSKKLQLDFNTKPITFILISVDDDELPWKKAIEKYKIYYLNSYRIPDFKNNQFTKSHIISALPRYMIFNKSGEVIISQAPNPSNPKIREIFEELLKKPLK